MTEEWTPEYTHPAFAAHFTDPLYESVSDEDTPFGSDEGADMLADWNERRAELDAESTVADVLEGDPVEYLSDPDDFDSVTAVYSAGFTLLRLTGRIDAPGLKATLDALEIMMGEDLFGPVPSLERQRADLLSWSN